MLFVPILVIKIAIWLDIYVKEYFKISVFTTAKRISTWCGFTFKAMSPMCEINATKTCTKLIKYDNQMPSYCVAVRHRLYCAMPVLTFKLKIFTLATFALRNVQSIVGFPGSWVRSKYGTERPTNGQTRIAAYQDCSTINRPNIKLSERRISKRSCYSELR